MLGPCGFETFAVGNVDRVDEYVSHIGLPALLDVMLRLGNVGLRLLLGRHAGQCAHIGKRIARHLHRRLGQRSSRRRRT